MELWDVYNEERIRTGRTMVRGRQMKPGDYHLIAYCHNQFTRADADTAASADKERLGRKMGYFCWRLRNER